MFTKFPQQFAKTAQLRVQSTLIVPSESHEMKAHHQLWTGSSAISRRLLRLQTVPILVDANDNIVAEGRMGHTHRQVFVKALTKAQNDKLRIQLIEALNNDAYHKFSLTNIDGTPVFDENGMRIIMDRIEAARIVDASGQRSKNYRGMPLQSQQLPSRHITGWIDS